MRAHWFWCLSFLMASIGVASAAAPTPIPDALREWVPWALEGQERVRCPRLAGVDDDDAAYACLWPGELQFAARDDGASFALPVTVHARAAVPLPGDADVWPLEVSSEGRSLAVVANDDGVPVVWLAPGQYRIEGRFVWDERPESIALPASIARIALSLDGVAQAFVQRDDDALWLGRVAATVAERDSLAVDVFRLLEDRVPARLETRFKFTVSGKGREEQLALVLPEGFVPVSLSGDLNARLDGDGTLALQVRSGEHWLSLVARATAPLAAVTTRTLPAPWPEAEIWSYRAQTQLRVTEPEGAAQIDPALAEVPNDWRELPAFALEPGQGLSIAERSRGLSLQDQNRLHLNRTLWLDHDGDGYTARDQVSGRMLRDWRLDLAPPYKAMRASENGEPVLITAGAHPGFSGVELRSRDLNLSATARIDAATSVLPATGWQQAFESVQTTLNVPPGFELIAATGADRAPSAWLDRWNLMDVFVAALIVFLFVVGFGKVAGLIPAAFVLLAWHEPDVPQWSLMLAIVAAILLSPRWREKLPRWSMRVAQGVLILPLLAAVPFVATQLRLGLHPQLEAEYGRTSYSDYYGRNTMAAGMVPQQADNAPMYDQNVAEEAPMPASMPAPAPVEQSQSLESVVVTGARMKSDNAYLPKKLKRYASNTMIQAGGGEPSWNWRSYSIELAGPVLQTQEVRLWLSPPWLTRLARFVIAALFALIAVRLVGIAFVWTPKLPLKRSAAALLLAGLAFGGSAQAQSLPDAEMIKELRERLLKAPECMPACGNIASAEVVASGSRIEVALTLHAAEHIGLPLPGNAQLLALDGVQLDAQAVNALYRDAAGTTWIDVPRGVHRAALRFSTAAADQIALAFPMAPAHVRFSGDGWEAAGIEQGRLPNGTLELTRLSASTEAPRSGVAQRFEPYVVVTRELRFDLDWEVATTVQRIAPESGAFSIAIPLLTGERVTSEGFEVVDGAVQVRFADGDGALGWVSRLEAVDALTLSAPELAQRAEIWKLVASPTWNVRAEGVPGVHPDDDATLQQFHPLPGEALTLAVSRPEAIAGRVVAIDQVALTSSFGKRSGEHTLTLSLRATQGGQHALNLPANAEVLRVVVRGETLNLRPEKGVLRLPLRPGVNTVEVGLRINEEPGLHPRLPMIDLGTHASNIELVMQLPSDRWVLVTSGPRIGPAVLYWGELIVMLLLAFAIARSGFLPIKLHEAFLLGIGFSTVSWWSLVLFAAVLAAFAWRARWPREGRHALFNLVQLALVVAALVAAGALLAALNGGLLGYPDLHVTGHSSTATNLRWFADQTAGRLPDASAWVLPMWMYRALMLAWAFWMAWFLIRIGRFVFESWTSGGAWSKWSAPKAKAPAAEPPPLEPVPAKATE
ncbi:MAG: hypothetical protein IPO95_11715 [Rhodanobacteraceae bacterium]|nr:hypothetical protein [Rhodanobacteraceae bacterium]